MDRNDSLTPQKAKYKNMLPILIPALLAVLLIVAELYVMIQKPGNLVGMAGIAVVLLACVAVLISAVLKEAPRSREEIIQGRQESREQFENTARSEKAAYLLLKKTYGLLTEMDETIQTDRTDEIISAQKKLSKVIIRRNKENTDAILNSNDRVVEKLTEVCDIDRKDPAEFFDRQREYLDESMKALMQHQEEFARRQEEFASQQQQFFSGIRQMEQNLKREILSVEDYMNSVQEQIAEHQKELISSVRDAVPAGSPVQPASRTETDSFADTGYSEEIGRAHV